MPCLLVEQPLHAVWMRPEHENFQPGPASSSGGSIAPEGPESSQRTENGYVLHKVTKLDTLAGLAIKYHVNVADIKRANGILSDNAMFAREHIKIPTGQLPVGEEAQVLFARLMSGYGRDASLNARERKAPGTVSITQLPGSPSASRSSAVGSEAPDDEPGTPYSRRSDKSSEPGDVELMERSLADTHAYGYGSDRVRRRTRNESNLSSSSSSGAAAASQLSSAAEAAVGWLSNAASHAAQAAQAALPAAGASCLPSGSGRRGSHTAGLSDQGTGSGSGTAWQQLSHAVVAGGSSLVKKIQKAASQPALMEQQHGGGFGDVADALLLKGGAGSRVPSITGSGGASIDLLARGMGLSALPPRKDTKGD